MLMLESTFCHDTANIWSLLGQVVVIIKVVIPLLLVILGMVDLGKAVISSDEKAMNKAVGTLIKRFIAAVVVFFIPTIVSALFSALGIIDNSENGKKDYNICIQCVTNVNGATFENGATCDTLSEAAKTGKIN